MSAFFKKIGDLTSGVGKIFKGKKIVSSNLDQDEELIISRLSAHSTDTFKNIDGFVVKEYEHVVLLHQGSIVGIADSGIFELEKQSKTQGTEIIWITKREFEIKWGSPSIYTEDKALIGCHGSCRVRINNPRSFVKNVVAEQTNYEVTALKKWIKHTLIGAIKTSLTNYTISELYTERKTISMKVRREINADFTRWGLELLSLDILGFRIPDRYMHLLEASPEEGDPSATEALIKKYERLIEKADEQLLAGELSEERHAEIVRRYQKKLTALRDRSEWQK